MASKFSQVVLFGDSLTEQSFSLKVGGWGGVVSDQFCRRADIINRGFSGYNTEWAKLILPQLITAQDKPDVVFIFFGANDAALPFNQKQHVPLASYKSNLSNMCSYLNSIGLESSALVLLTPPPVDEVKWLKHAVEDYGVPLTTSDRISDVTKTYAQAVLDLGRERSICTLDVYGAITKLGNIGNYLSDGLHFNVEGNKVVADLVISCLEDKFKGRPIVFPDWKDVDTSNLLKTFRLDSNI